MPSKWDQQLIVIGPRNPVPEGFSFVDTTSKAGWSSGLSPFKIGPCPLYDGRESQNMEAGWQFAKLYREFADDHGQPLPSYWAWAEAGWARKEWPKPMELRYPAGKGRKPLCSLWHGGHLGYVDARKVIYGPLYRDAVQVTDAYETLKVRYQAGERLALWDYDGYPESDLAKVLHDPKKKMGHAFVLAMMLQWGEDIDFLHDDHLRAPEPEKDLFSL